MSTEEKDKEKTGKDGKTETTGNSSQTATPTEGEDRNVTITVKHEFETPDGSKKPPVETPPASKPKDEATGEKPTIESEKDEDEDADETVKELRERLQERESQLATIALKAFEDEKTSILSKVTDPEKKKAVEAFIGDDPSKLEQVRFLTGIIGQALAQGGATVVDETLKGGNDEKIVGTGKPPVKSEIEEDGTEKIPPSGKAKAPKPTSEVNMRAIIDELYDTLQNPEATVKEKKEADKKITELYTQLVSGARKSGKIAPLRVMECPKCHEIMEDYDCACGYSVPRVQR